MKRILISLIVLTALVFGQYDGWNGYDWYIVNGDMYSYGQNYFVHDGDTVKIDPGTAEYIFDIEVGDSRIFGVDSTGNVISPASAYYNYGSTAGSGGYGLRDNSGTMQVKNSGGAWANIAGASGSAGGWTDNGTNVTLTTPSDTVILSTPLVGSGLNTLLAQGVDWDESADTYSRTGSISDIAVSQSAGDSRLIIQSAMRRCILNDDGEVVYYLADTNSAYTEYGAASDLTGGDGQVMVEIPKFYYKYSYSGSTHSWSISPNRLPGYNLHPAFYKNGAEVDYRYIGAYEAYLDSEAGGKLYSISGKYPATQRDMSGESPSGPNLSTNGDADRANFRTWAENRGNDWRQLDYDLMSAVQLLYLIEYADFYSQDMIGEGRTQLSGGSWEASSYIGITGLSNGDGNGTNAVDYDGDADNAAADSAYMTYRGIENFYGNIWKFVDGVTVDATADDNETDIPIWVTNDDALFADADSVGVKIIELTNLGDTDYGFSVTLEQFSRGFLPASVNGASSEYITDRYYQYSDNGNDWRVFLLGGGANHLSSAGVFYLAVRNAALLDVANIGGRLCF